VFDMELITIELSDLVRRSRSALVHHGEQHLPRGLDPLERVVIQDSLTGEYYAGTVADVQFEVDDTDYRVEIGVRLPEDLALDRLTGMTNATRILGTQRVADLLADLRGVSIPAPRAGRNAQLH